MKSEEDYHVALWVKRQIGTDMISCVYKIHRTSVAMSYIKLHYYILNHYGKNIQISTNMPDIGLVVREIAIEMLTGNKKQICMVKHGRPSRALKALRTLMRYASLQTFFLIYKVLILLPLSIACWCSSYN